MMIKPKSVIPAIACLGLFACGTPSTQAADASHVETNAMAELAPDAGPSPEANAAPPAPSTSPPAPEPASGDLEDGKRLTIKLADGRAVALQGIKVDAKAGLSNAQCGVVVDGKRLITMGADDTDAYTCGMLAAAGALPPDGTTQRIGLIYDVSSPNATFRTAVVLRDAGTMWQVDSDFAGRFDDSPAGRSIGELRKAVR